MGDKYRFLFECKNKTLVQYRNCYSLHCYGPKLSMYKCVTMLSNIEDNTLARRLGAALKVEFSLIRQPCHPMCITVWLCSIPVNQVRANKRILILCDVHAPIPDPLLCIHVFH